MHDRIVDGIGTASISLVGHIVARYHADYLVKSQRSRRAAHICDALVTENLQSVF